MESVIRSDFVIIPKMQAELVSTELFETYCSDAFLQGKKLK